MQAGRWLRKDRPTRAIGNIPSGTASPFVGKRHHRSLSIHGLRLTLSRIEMECFTALLMRSPVSCFSFRIAAWITWQKAVALFETASFTEIGSISAPSVTAWPETYHPRQGGR